MALQSQLPFGKMVIVKRLYTYMLQRFIPLLVMTFFICLFVVLMQFLFMRISDLVGKGLSFSVLGELFFYASLSMVPTALPLAVLLASLMTFGNLGEKFELTAMKASGISLFRIMRPLIVLMVALAIGAFFFQNNVLPIAQTKMWTLLFSVRQKTPEVEIPEKVFYDQIPNMNMYVDRKNRDTGMLYGMILYDMTRGQDNVRVILADSGRFSFTEDQTRLFLHLHNGEMFENLRDNAMGSSASRYMPFRRENFKEKMVYFAFDANFNRIDEEGMRSQYIGQNISQLSHSIDSIGHRVDSIGNIYAHDLKFNPYLGVTYYQTTGYGETAKSEPRRDVMLAEPIDIDSIFASPSPGYAKTYLTQALANAKRKRQEYEYRSISLNDQARLMRRHDIELQRKFTLSFACIIFFFIGAPLGAIIKKGGLGAPLVISVLLFIFYFIIDNSGFKMARDGKIEVWQGIWLSTAVLLPLGAFFTYKAVGDSAIFNIDAYRSVLLKLIGRMPKRSLELKELVVNEVEPEVAIEMLSNMENATRQALAKVAKRPALLRHWLPRKTRHALTDELNTLVEYMSNTRDARIVHLLNNYPFEVTGKNLQSVADNSKNIAQRIQKELNTSQQPT